MNEKMPWLKLHVARWLGERGFRILKNQVHKGYWADMLCHMHHTDEPGRLVHDGKPWPMQLLANELRLTVEQATDLVDDLLQAGVASIDENGVIFSRFMEAEARKENKSYNAEKKRRMRAKRRFEEYGPYRDLSRLRDEIINEAPLKVNGVIVQADEVQANKTSIVIKGRRYQKHEIPDIKLQLIRPSPAK